MTLVRGTKTGRGPDNEPPPVAYAVPWEGEPRP